MESFAFAIFGVIVCSAAYAAIKGAPWVPTWKRDIRRLLTLLELKKGEVFYELGCGDARVTQFVARATGGEAHGVELSLGQFFAAKIRTWRDKTVTIHFGDVFKQDLSRADAVYLFLMPETYEKIRSKLERELKPGCRVVTYVWPMPGWTPKNVDTCEKAPTLYLYLR